MAHFAELDENNTVLQVIVVHNNELLDGETESEAKGVEFCSTLFGHTNWVQTSYNNNMRKQFAGSRVIPTTQTVMSLLRLNLTQVGI